MDPRRFGTSNRLGLKAAGKPFSFSYGLGLRVSGLEELQIYNC